MTVNIKLDGYEAITGETSIDIVNQMADLQWPKTGDQILYLRLHAGSGEARQATA